jgi:hypothetical protein
MEKPATETDPLDPVNMPIPAFNALTQPRSPDSDDETVDGSALPGLPGFAPRPGGPGPGGLPPA